MKKGYKITDIYRQKKIGVAAETLEELIEKSQKKLGVEGERCRVCVAEDGTCVLDDEYLGSLPPQTLLVLLRPHQQMVTELNHVYAAIWEVQREYLSAGRAAHAWLHADGVLERVAHALLQRARRAAPDLTALSHRHEHPDWFVGLEPSEKTKEQAMAKRAAERMRGYYYKSRRLLQAATQLPAYGGRAAQLLHALLAALRTRLDAARHHRDLFDRSAPAAERLCDRAGLFACAGRWDAPACAGAAVVSAAGGAHLINPYASREERLLFSTWNLDHRVELSRAVVPGALAAAAACARACPPHGSCAWCGRAARAAEGARLHHALYYAHLFTRANLKLVHVACHDKRRHAAAAPRPPAALLCAACAALPEPPALPELQPPALAELQPPARRARKLPAS